MSRKIRIEKSEATGMWLVFAPSFGFVSQWPVIAKRTTHTEAMAAAAQFIEERRMPQNQYSVLGNEGWGPWTAKKGRI